MEKLIELFTSHYGCAPEKIEPLRGAGSNRKYFRMHLNNISVIGTEGCERQENEAFLELDRFFKKHHLPVPEVIAVSDDSTVYIQQDLGDDSLYKLIMRPGVTSDEAYGLLKDTLTVLAGFHAAGVKGLDLDKCYPRKAMDRMSVMWDLYYFKYCFLKLAGVNVYEVALEKEFDKICDVVATEKSNSLILRDFQSRNVMIHHGQPFVIDFQGARMGNPFYDVASFLWQARIALPDVLKWQLAREYVDAAGQLGLLYDSEWPRQLKLMALFRMLQVLGAYGFRGLHEHKAEFVTNIPTAIENALNLIEELSADEFPYLKSVLTQLSADSRFISAPSTDRLTVKVYSFSYKKGIPEDFTGNGGGFVFDCRAIHNPGRYDEYKQLTGLDAPVREFLENDGEVLTFLDSCYSLVDNAVSRYVKRGFTNLSVSFGCTGGRHRSVYSAQAMAQHIASLFDVDVVLIHREQNIIERL
ncbi:MAG: phosphotransferase [Firmicutes bacterium]|nr:phosphotransferase [Bacillota bacterium]MCM1400801.1 phosphotransferase [Bacteroides sp.]MCM1477654.1 phosphotransferase [Bacteroides sp.]